MLKAYKYRIYPTDEQKVLLAKTFGCCRWFYNFARVIRSSQSQGRKAKT
ncbi:helix-turn-helix domain-containing protein [Cyanobacterium aponinum UTEX 3222]|nr:helix-turn-helix domain-containing protein [Cyanobacterium aponinum UTEX 3222]WRL42773.1 helix-turn-helix domain-containing protein [Cyanobacterium aponinum UTEX 3222]